MKISKLSIALAVSVFVAGVLAGRKTVAPKKEECIAVNPATKTIVKTIKADGTVVTKVVEKIKPAPIHKPQALVGYSAGLNTEKIELQHSFYVGKRVLDTYVKDLYAIGGADINNKLRVTQVKIGLIKLF